MRRLELTLPDTWPTDDVNKLSKEIDDVLTHWAIQLQDSAQRISGAEVLVHDVDGVEQTLESFGNTYSQHDELDGVDTSTAHTLFLLLDGTRAMTGNLQMATHEINWRASSANRIRSQATNYLNVEAGVGIYFDIATGHEMLLTTDKLQLTDCYLDMDDHIIDNLKQLKFDTSSLTGEIGLTTDADVGTVFNITSGGGDMPIGQFCGDGATGLHTNRLLVGFGGYYASLTMNGANCEFDLDTAADFKFKKDVVWGDGAKAYFEASGSTAGTEWWASANDTFLDAHFAGGVRFYSDVPNLLLTIGPLGIAPTYVEFNAPANYYFQIAGVRKFVIATGGCNCYENLTVGADKSLILPYDRSGYQNVIIMGAGWDFWMGFDGANQIYSVTAITATAKHYFGATGTETIVCGSLEANAGMTLEQATISAAATLTAAHYIVLCDTNTAGAGFTVTLPAAASHTDRVYCIMNTGNSGYNVTVDGNGAEEINRALTQIVGDLSAMQIVSDGAAWWVL